jgi:hypothetical protein
MPFIPVNLDETVEQKPAPKGKYELMISGCKIQETGESSKHPGAPMLKVTLGFTDLSINAPVITHYITLPYEGDENTNFKLLMLKRFLVAFQIPYSTDGIDPEQLAVEMSGHTATLDVGLSEPNDDGNIFNRLVIPRLRDEQATASTGKKRR